MKEQIQKFFKGEVEDSEEILKTYSHDASLFEVKPRLVLFPKDKEDVKNIVRWVNENKDKYSDPKLNEGWKELSITARSAGTCMSGGDLGESLILDFTRHMNQLVGWKKNSENFHSLTLPGVPVGTLTDKNFLNSSSITVQPGMYYRDFEKITLEKGLILPCFTASKSLNAMGGMYGNNSAGERTLKYGKTEDYILEAKVIFSDGNEYVVKPLNEEGLRAKISQNDYEGNVYKNIYELIQKNKNEIKEAKPKVSKNSAGYYLWNVLGEGDSFFDLNKLLVGSQGTLGITTEITFRLVPNFKYSKLVAIFMNDLEPLGRLVDEILFFKPETVETYDDKTMKLAVRFFPDFLKNKGFVKMFKFMWSFMPELGMTITGGFPKLILLVEFAGENDEAVNQQCIKLKEKLKNFKIKVHITKSKAEAEKYWDIRRESFALLRKHVAGKRTAPFVDDIIVRPEFLPKFIPELNNIFSHYDLTYTIAGHAGDGNFHIIPLMDFNREDTAKIITEISDKVYDLVIQYHGSITAEHNDGIIRTPYLEKMYGSHIISIFQQIKNIFDPKNIFNPGKKVGGTKEYLVNHIIKPDHPKQDHKI
ncbi:MAG: FAD-binding oxidoreductase [bacterium]